MAGQRLDKHFFMGDAIAIAQQLIGKVLVRHYSDAHVERYAITETEAYRGEEDLACHASKGRTPRTDAMYHKGGVVYVYLIYGMYWLLNFVTSDEGFPAAVLIRGLEGINGPGRVGKALLIDRTFYGEDLSLSERIWVEDHEKTPTLSCAERIGVHYAGQWALKPWRYFEKINPNQ
jgi:DNA-3-methyladenine glycosylase